MIDDGDLSIADRLCDLLTLAFSRHGNLGDACSYETKNDCTK
jgi:hypothetical protein